MTRKTIWKSIFVLTLSAMAIGLYAHRNPTGSGLEYFNQLGRYEVCIIDRNYDGKPLDECEPKLILNEAQKAQLQTLVSDTKFKVTNSMHGFDGMYSVILFEDDQPLAVMYVFDNNQTELETFSKKSPYQFLKHDNQLYDKITELIQGAFP